MSAPVLTFLSGKAGVGKTSLVYHLAWMFSEMGKRVVAIDLDPQANLTSAFLEEAGLVELWNPATAASRADTVHQCVQSLEHGGALRQPALFPITPTLQLLPGDLNLSTFESVLSQEWAHSLDGDSGIQFNAMSALTAFRRLADMAAAELKADVILADTAHSLGSINRSALMGTDYVVMPLASDFLSLQSLRNAGSMLRKWRGEWNDRMRRWTALGFNTCQGGAEPLGYILQQSHDRVSRPVRAYDPWGAQIPAVYRRSVLGEQEADSGGITPENDPYCLSRLRHYRSLVPMAGEARKPIFRLTSADGAMGSHAHAVSDARRDFENLARKLLKLIRMPVV